ncbi:MAG: SusC/RagA family TonB-linked outer membrane protein [Gemmatimonadota bacterium]
MNTLSCGKRAGFWAAATVVLLCAAAPTLAHAQERGAVAGQVVDEATNQPLVGAQMSVVGTNIGGLTNSEGRFLIQNVPAGEREIRATLIGYSSVTREVTIPPGGTATADFELGESAIALEGLVVTATGQTQRRREVGSTVSNIDVGDVDLAPVQTFSQLIQGRAAGVSVLQSAGTSGTGARIRIRGANSISLSNEPLLIVDGVQVDNAAESFAIGIGGQSISRMNDINPEDIESIEVLKGPAASALYGTAAANGVIQITTKRGRAGTTRWNVYTEYGQLEDITDYPANYQGVSPDGVCRVYHVAAGTCEQSELREWNPLEEVSPFRTGTDWRVGMSARGGSDQVQYFLSGERDDEEGIYEANWVDRYAFRANLNAQLRNNVDVSLRSGYTTSQTALPGNDNNTFGFIGAGLLGSATDNDFTRGYFAFPNEWRLALDARQNLHRFINSLDVDWRPLDWLTLTGVGGIDLASREDVWNVPPGIWDPAFDEDNAIGNRFVAEGLIRTYTARGNAISAYGITEDINATSTLGGEFRQERFERTDAEGYNMLPGTEGLGSVSERFGVGEFNQTTRTVSLLGSQQLAWRDRVFVTGAVRGDRNSNFGQQFGFQWYPSMSASWVIAEEPWFPQVEALTSLRLRTAWGRSGLMPGFRTARQFYTASVATIQGMSLPAITVGGAGNPDLEPEQSEEWEVGFDAGFFNDRLGLEVAYYDKRSSDALVSRRLAPSLGSSLTQTVNLGKVSNTGWEAMLNARLLTRDPVIWDATFSYATNDNELVELGAGIDPIIYGIGGNSQRHAEDLPLGHYYGIPLLEWEDADNNGVIGLDEVVLGDSATYLGTSIPRRDISFTSTLTLFNHLRLFALVDHKGGHKLFNSTEEFRCNTFFNCRAINDPSAPVEEQARAVAAALGSIDPYVEDADFTKLREVSLSILGIERLLGRAGFTPGVSDISLTLAGRNLGTWTDYTGLDPEMNSAGQANHATYEFLGQPPVRTWTLRLNVGF